MRYLTAAVFAFALATGRAPAQSPKLGDVQSLNVVSISLQVGSTDKENKKVTYTPPPGWYIRSHEVHCRQKLGPSSYAVTTVPADWNYSSDEKANDSSRRLVESAFKFQDHGFWAKLLGERQDAAMQNRKASVSHHALMVDATAKGQGLFQGGGALELIISAELVYIGDAKVKQLAAVR